MNKAVRLIFLILVLIILLSSVYLFLAFRKQPLSEKRNVNLSNLNFSSTPSLVNTPSPLQKIKELTKDDFVKEGIKQKAALFAERFGSYSNQGNFSNIYDVKVLMSSAMQAWADSFIKNSQVNLGKTTVYSGVTTKALSVELTKFDSNLGQAEVKVSAQRQESSGSANNTRLYYQDIIIKFILEKEEWKVNEAKWGAEKKS